MLDGQPSGQERSAAAILINWESGRLEVSWLLVTKPGNLECWA